MARHNRSRIALYAGTALVAMFAQPVLAQEAAPDAAVEEGVITVTARRREESLLDVPIAISAISGTQLERSGAIDITDIAASVPTSPWKHRAVPIRRSPRSSAAWVSRIRSPVSNRASDSISTMYI